MKNNRIMGFICVRFLIAVALVLTPIAVFTQTVKSGMPVDITIRFKSKTDNPEYILYNMDKDLKIEYFKGRPDMNLQGVGATYSGIQMSMEGKSFNGKMEVNVMMMVYFDKSNSWMKPEGKDERVLRHEQIHFDLTAIYACRMYHAIMNETFTSKNVKQGLRDIQSKYTNALQAQQVLYDKQTIHGTIAAMQKTWAEKVQQMKSELDCM